MRRGPHAATRGRKPRVLIAEEDAALAERLSEWFGCEGWTVSLAADGAEVLDVLETLPADLVVLGLQLPAVNAWELLRCRRGGWGLEWPQVTGARVVVVSSRDEAEGARFARRLGADAVLEKPVDRGALRQTLGTLFPLVKSRRGFGSKSKPGS